MQESNAEVTNESAQVEEPILANQSKIETEKGKEKEQEKGEVGDVGFDGLEMKKDNAYDTAVGEKEVREKVSEIPSVAKILDPQGKGESMKTTEVKGDKGADFKGEAKNEESSDESGGESVCIDELPLVIEEDVPSLKELDAILGEVKFVLHPVKEKPMIQKKAKKASQPKKQTPGLRLTHKNRTFPKDRYMVSVSQLGGKSKPTPLELVIHKKETDPSDITE